MTSILLAIIYLAFISLGLPDSVLGSAWPSVYQEFQVPISYAGIITMIISAGTILSSLFSHRVIHRFGTGVVTLASVAMTAAALIGFSLSNSFLLLCIWSIPYGLGAGSVDAALNNFVALHYKARHMSWLHSFWGVGATAGPFIMGLCLTNGLPWNSGYQVIGVMQTVLVAGLLMSLPLWKKAGKAISMDGKGHRHLSLLEAMGMPGVKPILMAFFSYCAVETTAGLWASSYMVLYKGMDARTAAKWAAIFYLGITAGRFLSGFITDGLGNRSMVRAGQILALCGTLVILLPLGNTPTFTGLILLGLGCAPIFPSMLHATPDNFGRDKSQAIMGMQMASAYFGTTFMPLAFGFIGDKVGIWTYPIFLMVFVILMLVMMEGPGRLREGKRTNQSS